MKLPPFSDGARYRARIAQLSDKAGAVELLEALPANESPLSITLYQGLPKAEKLEFLAQMYIPKDPPHTPLKLVRESINAFSLSQLCWLQFAHSSGL